MRNEGKNLTKIQLFQLLAIVILAIYVAISYKTHTLIEWLFYPIVIMNILLWVLRLHERRQKPERK